MGGRRTIATFASCLVVTSACGDNSGLAPAGEGLLSVLAIDGLPLSPTFSPTVFDYTLPCVAGPNAISVHALSDEGATVRLLAPIETSEAEEATHDLVLDENEAIVVQVEGVATNEYWVRCLPHDFPQLRVSNDTVAVTPSRGWYLVGNVAPVKDGGTAFAMVLDERGTPVWYRRSPNGSAIDVTLLERNVIAFAPSLGAGFGTDPAGKYQIHDLASGTVELVGTVGAPTDVHELIQLPTGNRMLLSYPVVHHVDLTGLEAYTADSAIVDCAIQEVSPDGELVWEWRALDHVDPVQESTSPTKASVDGEDVVDVFHCNSLEVSPEGDVMVSMRHASAVMLIDKATKAIRWKLGGSAFSLDGAQLVHVVDDPLGGFHRQHDARFQPDGSISMFDNQSSRPTPARGVVYALDLATQTATMVMQVTGAASSPAMGSFRINPDGTSVVGWGYPGGGTGLVLTEFTASGQPMLELSFPAGNASYRAIKVSPPSLDIALLRRDAGES
ncbi:MAG: arylsulfotransferase family protein [Kofleriaceae bacterium]